MHTSTTDLDGGRRSASRMVVSSVADAKGVAPEQLQPPLYDAIDPDALDRLIDPGGRTADPPSVVVRFSYSGFTVRVDGSTVRVSEEDVATADEDDAACDDDGAATDGVGTATGADAASTDD